MRISDWSSDVCSSDLQVTAPAQTPIDPAARFHRTHDMLAQMLVERGPPGNERETHAIVDHCEPARCERDALAADAGDGIALLGRVSRQSGAGRDGFRRPGQFACPQGIEQVDRESTRLNSRHYCASR